MNRPIQSFAKVGIVLGMAFPSILKGEGPIEEAVGAIAADPFFTAIELSPIVDPAVRERVRSLCQQSRLTVAFAAQPALLLNKLSLNSRDAEARQAAVARAQDCIEEAIFLGAERLAVLSGPDPGPEGREEVVDLLVDSLRQLCAYSAERGGPPISLETFDRDIDKRCLVGPTALAVAVAQRVREAYPSFGLLLDLSHQPLLGESSEEMLGLAKEVVVQVHLGNCVKRDATHPAYGDVHPRFGIAGGENDVAELRAFLRELFKIGFLGGAQQPLVSFEVKPLPGESSALVIAGTKRALETAWWEL